MTTIAPSAEMTYREALGHALRDAMTADDRVLLIGEDVGAAGGVFKVSDGLLRDFPGRVLDTPIAENGFVGMATGMAVTGWRPVVEIMFAEFLHVAADSLVNDMATLAFMSGGQTTVPVTVRTAGGSGNAFGPQHSATAESWYMHVPGLRIAAAASPASAYSLLRAAIELDEPTLFIEHKGRYLSKGPVTLGNDAVAPFGEAEIVRRGSHVTVAATMLMVDHALAAAEELATQGIEAEVIDMRWISPLDVDTVGESVGRTGRLVVAEEQVHDGGWGATLISRLAQAAAPWTAAPVSVSMPRVPIPASPPLEAITVPSAQRIAAAIHAVVA
jgi:acetoin:2,6-dichlorophenolindophenol oxidoreductase subunit beta